MSSGINLDVFSFPTQKIDNVNTIHLKEFFEKFIEVFEAHTYLSDKYDKYNSKAHEKICNSDLGAGFEQWTIKIT